MRRCELLLSVDFDGNRLPRAYFWVCSCGRVGSGRTTTEAATEAWEAHADRMQVLREQQADTVAGSAAGSISSGMTWGEIMRAAVEAKTKEDAQALLARCSGSAAHDLVGSLQFLSGHYGRAELEAVGRLREWLL